MKKIFLLLLLLCSLVGGAMAQTITSFIPLSAKPGDPVTITGTGFNTTPANNIVFFGGTKATVTGASTISITATVPTSATYAPISVLNSATGNTAYSRANFNLIYAPAKAGITVTDFLDKVDFTTGSNPNSVAIGDLNGDGKLDLVVSNRSENTVSVYRNISSNGSIGASSFATKVDFITGNAPVSVAVGDLDGDGKPDLVVVNTNSSNISVLRNTSSGSSVSFSNKVDFNTGEDSNPYSVAIGDLDGDGKPDLAVASNALNTISVFRNTSNGSTLTFATKVDFATGQDSNPRSVAIGDLNGDGKPDLVAANESSNTISIFRNTSSSGSIVLGSFAAKQDLTTEEGSSSFSVVIGDLDGDGKPDLAVANYGSSTISVYRNTNSSTTTNSFAGKVDFTTGLDSNPFSVVIGDLDGDGKPDLAVANGSSNTISVLRNTSTSGSIVTGSFAPKVDFATGDNPQSVVIGDLDGDGKPDLAVANRTSNSVSVFRNADIVVPTITSFSPASAKPGDNVIITGTGFNTTLANNIVFLGATKATVTAATATSITATVPTGATYAPITVLNTALVKMAYSRANFNPIYTPSKTSIAATDFLGKVDFNGGNGPYSVAIGDLDDDGKPDLVMTNSSSSTVSVYRNISSNGSIAATSFASKVDFTTLSNPQSVAIGDLDGDGKLDLAVTNIGNYSISVLRNTSTSGNMNPISFATKVDFSAERYPESVAIGDLDGDGKPELTTANSNSKTVSVYRNTSSIGSITTSSFANKVDFSTGGISNSVAIGDLDGDGKPDLVTTNYNSNTISILQNTRSSMGIISFASEVNFPTGIETNSVVIGDLDGDGKPDLTVVNQQSNTASVFRNTSSSGSITTNSFATKVDFSTGSFPQSVAIGDLNGDGKPDLATANRVSNTVSVFLNTSNSGSIITNSFATKVDFSTGNVPFSVAIGDLDGDGKPDLATANNTSNTVSIFRNADIVVPTITITGSLNAFSACAGTASATQTFTVSGTNLTANILVTAPSGYEVSTTSGSGFANSVTLPQSGGTVSNTTLYARLTSSATGSPSGNIALTSTGATTQNVVVSGTVNALPTITLGSVSNITTTATTFSLPFTATAGSPNQYSITAGTPNTMSGFSAVANASLTGSPLSVTVPASTANTYNFVATVSNSTTGCVSANNNFTVGVIDPTTLFITRWDLSKTGSGPNQISFGTVTSGTVSYTWQQVGGSGLSGSGTFTNSPATITGLPTGGIIDLSINPTNFQRININFGTDRSRLTQLKQWGTVAWNSMQTAFLGCNNFTLTATDVPNLAGVTIMFEMFRDCSIFNQALPEGFNTAAVTNMSGMFSGCSAYNQPLPSSFNTAAVTSMSNMFSDCRAYNQPLPSSFNTAAVTNMTGMFANCRAYNQALPSSFNTAAVTSMSNMFQGCSSYNQPLPNAFNTVKVTSMSDMFQSCLVYNQPLPSSFNTVAVTNMRQMFINCFAYNQPLPNSFNTAAVTNMAGMFFSCSVFNQPLPSSFNTATVTDMSNMFNRATAFNQNVGNFNIAASTDMTDIFKNSGISTANYDAILTAWNTAGYTNKNLGNASPLKYCASEADRANLVKPIADGGKGWTITGDTKECPTPSITSISPTEACVGGSITLIGTNFTGATAVRIGGVAAINVVVVSATEITATLGNSPTSTVEVTTPNGTAISTASITVRPLPNIPEISGSAEICEGEVASLSANSLFTFSNTNPVYQWSNGTGGFNIQVSPSVTSTYSVTVTVDGCTSESSAVFTVIVNPKPAIPTITADNMTICKGGIVILTGACAATTDIFRWETPPLGNVLTNSNQRNITQPGVYKGFCESNKGCLSEKQSITITLAEGCNPANFITVSPEKPAICPNTSINLTANGCSGGTVTWLYGTSSQTGNNISVSPSVTTSYFVNCSTGGSTIVDVVVAVPNITVATNISTGKEIYKATNSIQSNKKIGNPNFTPAPNVVYEAGGSITLSPGFVAEKWSVFKAEIKTCN